MQASSNNNHQPHDAELTMDTEQEDKRAEYLKGKTPMRVTNKYQAFLYTLFFFFFLTDPENDQEE